MVAINEIVEQVDSLISLEEEELIRLANERYEAAIAAATKEFKDLQKLDPSEKLGGEAAQKIISKALDAFNEEYEKMSDPIKKAMLKAYNLGLKETGKIIEAEKEAGDDRKD
jgi:hypothetical protein